MNATALYEDDPRALLRILAEDAFVLARAAAAQAGCTMDETPGSDGGVTAVNGERAAGVFLRLADTVRHLLTLEARLGAAPAAGQARPTPAAPDPRFPARARDRRLHLAAPLPHAA